MDTNQWTLAWISIALAVGLVLLSRVPRPVLVLLVSSVVGALVGVLTLMGLTSISICDFPRVDRCSGMYIALFGEHRLPQFMQGHSADAWLIGISAFLGVVVADLIALVAMWAWARRRREEPALAISPD